MRDDEIDVDIQSYSLNHMDMLVKARNIENFRFRGIMVFLNWDNVALPGG